MLTRISVTLAPDLLYSLEVRYPATRSIRELKAAVAARVATLGPNEWVLGQGWDEAKFEERRLVTAQDLDEVAPTHPVWLVNTTGHYGVANSVALALAHITKLTADPPSGTIDRLPNGTPTGVLKESAQSLVADHVPPFSAIQVQKGMGALVKAFNAEGMTGLKDPGISASTWHSYQQVLADSSLTVRVFALWSGGKSVADAVKLIAEHGATTKPYLSTGDDRLIAGGVKLFADGSGGARTAWVYDEWNRNQTEVDKGNRGYPASNPDTLRLLIKMYHDAGLHISTHAIGDRTIDWIVDSYQLAMDANPKPGLRHGIVHANIPTDHALDVMAAMQQRYDAAYPEPSATFMWSLGDNYAGNFGLARTRRLNPFNTYRKRGIKWANGSDFPVTPFPARYGIWAAIARQPALGLYPGDPYGRDESVDVHTALRAATMWPARQMFLEKKIGSIEVGKYADLAVWDRDPYAVPTDSLKDMKCQLTVFNGKVVFEAVPLTSPALAPSP